MTGSVPAADIFEQVRQAIARYAMLPPPGAEGVSVGVAVSGGADSVCLLEVLIALAAPLGLRLSVLHVNHQLRGRESAADTDFVAALAEARRLPLHLRSVDVQAAASRSGDNLEQAARRARHAFFREFIASGGAARIATGHNQDDQSETVLFRILRGCGLTGLAGILPVTREGLIRPLLDVPRDEIRAFLRARGIAWREDATNADVHLARNRLRHDVLPALRRDFNPQLDAALGSLAGLAREEEEYWQREIPPPALRNGTVVVEIGEFADVHPALARRRARAAILSVKGDLRQIELAHVERILSMAREEKGGDRAQIPGVDVFRSFRWIRFAPARHDNLRQRNFRFGVDVPGRLILPDGTRVWLELQEGKASEADYARVRMDLDWSKVLDLRRLEDAGWELRNWRPGDHYQPVRHVGDQKLKQLFQEHRVPLWERRNWPVLVCKERILWARQFGPSASLAATPESTTVLRVREDYISGA